MILHYYLIILALVVSPSIAFSNTPVTPNLIEDLKRKLNDGQLSPEKGLGEHANTLAEQIQFLENELLKQERTSTMPTVPTNRLSPTQPFSPNLPASDKASEPTYTEMRHTNMTTHDTQQLRIAGLEARIALLEKQMATLNQQNRLDQTNSSNLGNTYGS